MKFLCLVHFAPDAFGGIAPEYGRRLDDATIEHDRKLRQSGHLLIASPLAGETVAIDRRKRVNLGTTDGPFAEAKEGIGGFILIEAKDIDAAASLFDDDPIAAYGRLEIRPLNEEHRHGDDGGSRPDFKLI